MVECHTFPINTFPGPLMRAGKIVIYNTVQSQITLPRKKEKVKS